MTLLFLTPHPSSHLGGVERHVRLLTRELERRGHRVIELSLEESDLNQERTVLSIPKGPSFKYQAWKKLWNQRRVIENADLVHIHDVFWWYLPFRFLYPHKPVFTTFHGWEGVHPLTRSAVFQKKLAQRLSRGTIGVGTFFEKWYRVTPTFTTFGALESKVGKIGKKTTMSEKIKRIAFFGRLEPVNGIDIAIPAFSQLRKRKYQILSVGDGSWRSQAERTGMVTGMVKNPWTHLLKSDLVITSSYLSILETAALARPIVSIATNPLKRDYLSIHPLAPLVTIVSSSEELLRTIQSFNILRYRDKIHNAQSWALKQTPQPLVDLYEKLWKDVS